MGPLGWERTPPPPLRACRCRFGRPNPRLPGGWRNAGAGTAAQRPCGAAQLRGEGPGQAHSLGLATRPHSPVCRLAAHVASTAVRRQTLACVRSHPAVGSTAGKRTDRRSPRVPRPAHPPSAVPSTTSITTTPSRPEISLVAAARTARAPPMEWPTTSVGTRRGASAANIAFHMATTSAVIVCVRDGAVPGSGGQQGQRRCPW
jgi:hypothetical protein